MTKTPSEGLRGPDKQQGSLREGPPKQTHVDDLPEELRRPRKGPYDKDRGRDEEATQVPAWTGKKKD